MDHPTFTRAITRKPAQNFAEGLSTQSLGAPKYDKALEQHAEYCAALRQCGLELVELAPEPAYPDSTFVEDTAILTSECAIVTRPGAESRRGEIDTIQELLYHFYPRLYAIQPPGTVDGGDICEAGSHFFIGISERTNVAGAVQLAEILAKEGFTNDLVDVRSIPGILHLKSGLSYLGGRTLVVIEALADNPVFRNYELLKVQPGEEYAANCIRVNDFVLIASDFSSFRTLIEAQGYRTLQLAMSEFQKMDGGLSCLSLRF